MAENPAAKLKGFDRKFDILISVHLFFIISYYSILRLFGAGIPKQNIESLNIVHV